MMDVTCITCSRWSPKGGPEDMARQGFGKCEYHEPWLCFPGERLRDCIKHTQADEATIAARRQFIARSKK